MKVTSMCEILMIDYLALIAAIMFISGGSVLFMQKRRKICISIMDIG